MKYKFLKSEEVQEILKAYPNTKSEILAEKHGVPVHKIYATASRHKVKKSEEFLASSDSGRMLKGNCVSPNTQFKKGRPSLRKGKKIVFKSAESKKKSCANRWKKGNIPPNIAQDGEVRWREGIGYYFIRLSDNVWVLYHKWLWERENGEVPKGFKIVFKDKNRKHCVIDNLECVSDAELMLRNTVHRLPEDLKKSIKKLSKIKRIIKKKSHE